MFSDEYYNKKDLFKLLKNNSSFNGNQHYTKNIQENFILFFSELQVTQY